MTLTSDPATVAKGGDVSCAADHSYGQTLILRETGGSAVKLTKFVAGGYDYSDRIASWFGSQTLSANGTLRAKICWQINSPPVTLPYEMNGVDGSGRPVQATLNVQFRGNVLDEKSGGPNPEPIPMLGWPGARVRRPPVPHRQTPGLSIPTGASGGDSLCDVCKDLDSSGYGTDAESSHSQTGAADRPDRGPERRCRGADSRPPSLGY